MSDFIRTISGTKFFPLDPDPKDIHLSDIAHSLSMVCRWAGHIPAFYSVGLHSLYVSYAGPGLAGLLHDASEAYLGDMAKPIKRGMPEYQHYENQLMTVIAQKFGFEFPLPEAVHQADAAAMYAESVYFGKDEDIPIVAAPNVIDWWDFSWGESLPRFSVRDLFISRFNVLTQQSYNEETHLDTNLPLPIRLAGFYSRRNGNTRLGCLVRSNGL